jgi:hypothetical protein
MLKGRYYQKGENKGYIKDCVSSKYDISWKERGGIGGGEEGEKCGFL